LREIQNYNPLIIPLLSVLIADIYLALAIFYQKSSIYSSKHVANIFFAPHNDLA